MTPCWIANLIRSVRLWRSSFCMMCSRCDIAVLTLMSRSSATSLLLWPFGDEFQDLLLSIGERFVRVGGLTGGCRPGLLTHRLAGHVRIEHEPAA